MRVQCHRCDFNFPVLEETPLSVAVFNDAEVGSEEEVENGSAEQRDDKSCGGCVFSAIFVLKIEVYAHIVSQLYKLGNNHVNISSSPHIFMYIPIALTGK